MDIYNTVAPIPTRQLCKRCMKYSGLAFHTPDETWMAVTDNRYQHLCLPCFVDMANERMIDWEPELLIYGESMAHLRRTQERVARGEYTDEGLTEWKQNPVIMETTNTTTHPVLGDPIGDAPPMEWTEKDQQLADANATIERLRKANDGWENADTIKDMNAHIEQLTEALAELVHLHGCEQEGLQSGKPTPEQWFNAVNKAHDVLWPKTIKSKAEEIELMEDIEKVREWNDEN